MPEGIFVTVTHTGFTSSAILLADVYPTTDGHTAFNRAGPVYVPVSGSIVLTYSDTVALSFEKGNIRKFVDAGYLTAVLSLGGSGVTFPASSGDVSGTYPSLTVVGIQGFPIQDAGGPNNGDSLIYNSLTGLWEHSPIVFGGGPPVGPAGGDLSGLYPNPGVLGLQTDPLPATVADGFLKRNALNTGWEEVTYGSAANTVCEGDDARLSDARTPTGAAGGDLAGTYPNPTLALLAVTDAKVAVANKDGLAGTPSMRTLGAGATQACAGNDARLSDPRTPTGAAGGDLAGTYPNPTVDGLQARPVDGAAPNANDALVWDGAKWTPTSVGSALQAVYGSFSDTTDQAFVVGAPFVVKYDTTEASNGVSVANDPITLRPTRLTVAHAGVYALTISPQILHTGGGGEIITFWLRLNGLDVPRTASSLEMGNNNNRTLPYIEVILSLAAGQYVEWVFTATTGTNVTLEHYNAVTSPPAAFAVPAIPSVIAGVKRIGTG